MLSSPRIDSENGAIATLKDCEPTLSMYFISKSPSCNNNVPKKYDGFLHTLNRKKFPNYIRELVRDNVKMLSIPNNNLEIQVLCNWTQKCSHLKMLSRGMQLFSNVTYLIRSSKIFTLSKSNRL